MWLHFRAVDDVPAKKGMDMWNWMSSKWIVYMYLRDFFLPLNSSVTVVYARSAFYPNLHFTLSLHFTLNLYFTPGPQSAVHSLQSAFYTDWFPKVVS